MNRTGFKWLLLQVCQDLCRSKEVLQEALNLFEGTALIVSHDRSFLDGVVNKVLEISTRKARMLTCNVSEYMERLEVSEF